MEVCAVICRKATVALSDANIFSSHRKSPSSRAQNRGFCAFLASGTPIFRRFEHKIEVFVRFCPSEPLFSGISSTKSGFLCSMTWSFEYWESFLPFHGWCHRRIALLLTPTTARRQPRTPAVNQPTPDARLQRPPGTTAWTDSIDRQYGPIELDRRYWNANQPITSR